MERSDLSGCWRFLHERMPKLRAQKLEQYAAQYLEPALKQFPELKEPVFLSLRNYGFIGRTEPVYHIVVNEILLDSGSEWRIRFCTAYLMMYFIQHKAGIALLPHANDTFLHRQAMFFTLTRGFAYDFLKVFQSDCSKPFCDLGYSFAKAGCKRLFQKPCRLYRESELQALASHIQNKDGYDLFTQLDFEAELFRLLSEAHRTLSI